MHKRLKLDVFQRSSDDDTSSGCSSAGGGMRNVIITPPRDSSNVSSSKLYYSMDDQSHLQQQQPRNGMLSSRNSFSPYSIRPLVVRAKRKRTEGTTVNVTSTAQRIIDTLNNLSTPVVNSTKVPFDSLKNFRPIVTPIRRDTQGPPIMKSPLVPAPDGKIYYNPGMNIHIPRLVEFGTNTDLTMSTFTYDHLEELNSNPKGGGGKMKLSSRVHSAPIKPNGPPSLPPQLNNHITPSSLIEPSKFYFKKSWDSNNVQQSLDSDQLYSTMMDFKSTKNVGSLNPLCRKCNANLKPDLVPPTKDDTTVGDSKKLDSKAIIPLKTTLPPTNTWDCPTCMVPNKPEASACVCCGEKNPSASQVVKPPPTTTTALKTWECPTCMVQNKPEASSCICCSEKNSNASQLAKGSTTTTIPSSSFQFGFNSTPVVKDEKSSSNSSTPLSTFTFGAPASTLSSSSSTTTKSTFTFGVSSNSTKPETPSSSSNTPTSSTYTFGTSSPLSKPISETIKSPSAPTSTTTSTETSKSSFTFGNNNNTPKAAIKSTPVSFGLPAPTEPSTATAAKSNTTFGLSKTPEGSLSTKAATPPTIEKSLVSQSQPNNPFGSFAFGTTKTTSSLSGVIQDDVEFWHCDKCPARTRMTSTHCVGCLGPKPTVDSSKSKPTSVKRFHFEPFFGGKVEDSPSSNQSQNQITSSYPEEELKRKPASSSSSSGSSLGFMYTPPSEPALKLKSPEPTPAVTTLPSEIKTGSFLDALKQGPQFSFSTSTNPTSSIIPSGTTQGQQPSTTIVPVSSVSSVIPSTTSNPVTAVSSTTSTWGAPPPGLFQFGAPASMNPSNAGTNNTMSITGNNNMSNNNGLKTTMFTFGGMKNGPATGVPVSSSSTPSIFGSSLSTGGVGTTPSVFGSSSIAPPAVQPNPAVTSPFNLTPNINFMSPGATGAQPPAPGSFVFNAQPPAGGGSTRDVAQRKFRKATRRIRQ